MMSGLRMLDLETSGLNPKKDALHCIQSLDLYNPPRDDTFDFWKAWDHPRGERGMVEQFFDETAFHKSKSKWQFIPVGTNLGFEFKWLYDRALRYGIISPMEVSFEQWVDRPYLDVQPILIFFNGLEFKGCGLNNYSRKSATGADVPYYAERGLWHMVEKYVRDETLAFKELFAHLAVQMPTLWADIIAPAVGRGKNPTGDQHE